MKATLLYECKDSIGEAATWLNDLGLFLWVDINGGLLHTYSPGGDAYAAGRLPGRGFTIVPVTDGGVVLSLQGRFVAYVFRAGGQEGLRGVFPQGGWVRLERGWFPYVLCGLRSPRGRIISVRYAERGIIV